jgi:hypothetical protein
MRASAVPLLAAAILTLALLPAHAADGGGLVFVPWKLLNPGEPLPANELVLYWIPLSSDDFRRSELLTYQPLTTYSRDCVSLSVIRADDSALAVRLPVLREPLLRRTIGRSVLRAAAIGALPWFPAEQFPPLAVEQVRMSQRIGAARGQSSTLPVPPELCIVLGVGLPMRSVARRLAARTARSEWLVRSGVAAVGSPGGIGGDRAVADTHPHIVLEKGDVIATAALHIGGRLHVGTPDEIAGPVLFLCTPLAAFITGEVFNVNGGAVLAG